MTRVVIYGEMADILGRSEWLFELKTPIEAVRALEAATGKLYLYLAQHAHNAYCVVVDNKFARSNEFLTSYTGNFKEIALVPVAAGAGAGEIFTVLGIGLIGLALAWTPLGIGTYAFLTPAFVGTMGAALLLGGIAQLTLGTAKGDTSNKKSSYLFNGAVNMYQPGGPVPICYGMLRVGSQVISAGISNTTYYKDVEVTTTPTISTGQLKITAINRLCDHARVYFSDSAVLPANVEAPYQLLKRKLTETTWTTCTLSDDFDFSVGGPTKYVNIYYPFGVRHEYRIKRNVTNFEQNTIDIPYSLPVITLGSLMRALQERYVVAQLVQFNGNGAAALDYTHFSTIPFYNSAAGNSGEDVLAAQTAAAWPNPVTLQYLNFYAISLALTTNPFPKDTDATTTAYSGTTVAARLNALRTLIGGSTNWCTLTYVKDTFVSADGYTIAGKTQAQILANVLGKNTSSSHPDFTTKWDNTNIPWTDPDGDEASCTEMARLLLKFICSCQMLQGPVCIFNQPSESAMNQTTWIKATTDPHTDPDRSVMKAAVGNEFRSKAWVLEDSAQTYYGVYTRYLDNSGNWQGGTKAINFAFLIDLRGVGRCSFNVYAPVYLDSALGSGYTTYYGDTVANNIFNVSGKPETTPSDPSIPYYTAERFSGDFKHVAETYVSSTDNFTYWDSLQANTPQAQIQTGWAISSTLAQWDHPTNTTNSILGGWMIPFPDGVNVQPRLIITKSNFMDDKDWLYYGAELIEQK